MTAAAAAPFGLSGLSADEVAQRRAAGRANVFDHRAGRSFVRIVRDNSVTPVNVILFLICAVLLGLGLFGDAVLTGGLVLGNIVVGVFQEARAKRQLERIALLTRPRASVIRGSVETQVPPDEVVEGDLLVLRPGDQVLVDGPVIVSRGLAVDESLLTGESEAVQKKAGDALVSGSYCVAGTGVQEAASVGGATLANQLTAQARALDVVRTPLQREVGLVIWAMSLVVVFLGAEAARSLSAAPGEVSLSEAVRAAAVIVALVPQGLAVMVTVSYAMAAVRMVGTGVLVQHMNALESISHVDVLCLDKTGTITTNRLVLEALAPLEMDEGRLRALLGDFAASAGYSNRTLDGIRAGLPGATRRPLQEVPFESDRGWSALRLEGVEEPALFLGAPERLVSGWEAMPPIRRQTEEWAKKGLRVLLFASAADPGFAFDEAEDPALPARLKPLGLVVLRDETRPDAAEVVAGFAAAGIELKIISGDHPETVAALATQAGIAFEGEAVSGRELERMDDEQLREEAARASIFGRVSPAVKERIVRALQRRGRYVAMIGDGVNDVPAMKAAQVAVALRSGSGITRSIADLVLLRDEFSKLPAAFGEGQRIRKGMEGIFRIFLTRTLSLTLILLVVSLLNDPFPVSPRHTALIALMTVGIPSLGLAVWARPARTGRTLILPAAHFILPAAAGIAAVGVLIFEFYWSTAEDLEAARTALTIACVLCGLLLIPFLEPPTPAWTAASPLSGDWRPAILAAVLLAAFAAILALEDLRRFYELQLPDVWGFLIVAIVVAAWAAWLRAFWRLDLPGRLAAGGARILSRLRRPAG